MNRSDPNGELGIISTCVIGGAVSMVTSYIGAKATGQDFTIKDAAISFGIGAISYSPLKTAARLISSVASAFYAGKTALDNNASLLGVVGCTLLAAGISYFSISNLKCIGLGKDDVAIKAVLDLTFGTAGSLGINYTIKSTANNKQANTTYSNSNTKQTTNSDQAKWEKMTQHYRGQVVGT